MAASDIVIVDFPSLEQAIERFKNVSNSLTEDSGQLQNNASHIASAIISAASDTYQQKINKLKTNVDNAKTALDKQIADLTNKLNDAKQAENEAQRIANTVKSDSGSDASFGMG